MQAVYGLGEAVQQPPLHTGSKARGMECGRVGAAVAAGDREDHGEPEGRMLQPGDQWVHTAPLTALEALVPVEGVDREGRAPAHPAQGFRVLVQDRRLSWVPQKLGYPISSFSLQSLEARLPFWQLQPPDRPQSEL